MNPQPKPAPTAQHTPRDLLPLRLQKNPGTFTICSSSGSPFAFIYANDPAAEKIADLIPRAVNSHAELLAALGAAWDFVENVTQDDPERDRKFFAVRAVVRDAIAKAETRA